MSSPQTRSISSIQSLRGIAALAVVFFHILFLFRLFGLTEEDVSPLQAGVDVFFVISGFIMWITTSQRPERTATDFYRDRVIRIVPLYWMLTIFFLMLVHAGAIEAQQVGSLRVLTSLTFIAHYDQGQGIAPALLPGWTLNYEMFFYLIFGVAILLGGRNLLARATIVLASLGALLVVGRVADLAPAWIFYTNSIIIEFAFGIVLAIIYDRRPPRPSWKWLGLTAAGLLVLAWTITFEARSARGLFWGVPAAMIVAGTVFARPVSPLWLTKLGDWSYALYLSHWIILGVLLKVLDERPFMNSIPFAALAAIICVAVAALIYHVVELPLTIWLRKVLTGETRAPAGGGLPRLLGDQGQTRAK